MSKRNSSRKEEVAAIVMEMEKKAAEKLEEAIVQETPAPHLPEEEIEGLEEDEETRSQEDESDEEVVENAGTPGPKLVGKRKGRAPISPEGALVRVLTFLPRSLVAKIHDTGRPMSRYIRELVEEKLGE